MVKFDLDLIYLQAENARMSLKDLSHHLKKSPQRLKYSLSILDKESILTNPFCIFDYSYFGLILFRVYFKGGYIHDHEKEIIMKELSGNSFVTSIYELTGEFDFVVEFASPNPSKFNKELKRISSINSTLKDYKIILNLVTYIYPRNYISKNQDLRLLNMEGIIGGDRERELFNKNEKNVIRNLILDPRTRVTELAKKSELNVKTVKSIVRNLMKKNIIRGFKYNIDTNKLGVNKSRLFLKLHNLSLDRESELNKYMLNTKEIVQVNKTVGDWDMEVDIESFDKGKIRYITMQIRELFVDLIERFNIIEFYKYYKRSYLPSYLFKEGEDFQDKIIIIDLKK
ncbi:AsnC family transcriptional regulator [Candidatus Woesearchaeota archaeon]|nr:AsnC family transcriptional regulator [Candidatus Woesearchaeota archaeon]